MIPKNGYRFSEKIMRQIKLFIAATSKDVQLPRLIG